MPEPQSTDLNPEIRRIVDAARGVWTRRLIDHFRANSLLFYRDLKVGTIDLTAETEAVGRLLAGDTLTVERLVSPARHAGNPDPVVRARAEAEASQKVRGALVALQRKALSNLEAFLIAVGTNETLEHPVHAVIEPVRSFDGDSTKDWCARHLEPDAEVYSDGLFCFRRFADAGHAHAHAVLGTGGGCAACEVKGALGQRAAGQRQAGDQWQLPCNPAGQVRAPLPGRSGIPFQPSLSPARDAAATGAGDDALQAPSRACSAHGE